MGAVSRIRAARVELGRAGEKAAADLLRKRGYEIVGAGFLARRGELDLVCRRGNDLVVVEVKTRTDDSFGTPLERDRVDAIIRRRALAWSVCAVDHAQVDSLGLIRARHLATAGAVAGLKIPAEYLLVDAWDVPEAPLPQMAVVRGDRTCASIMAASIVAKVARDKAMVESSAVISSGRRNSCGI